MFAGQREGCRSDSDCRSSDRNAVCNTSTRVCECGRIEIGYDGRCGTGQKVTCPDSGDDGNTHHSYLQY